MRKIFKISLLVALLFASLASAWGFSLLGPLPSDAGGEPWQVPVIGYALPGDIGGPHNLGEEYRRVTPFMFYTYDASFLSYFGLAGATNVDAAFAIMNYTMGTNNAVGADNLSAYSPGLTEFPDGSQSYNASAQALFLTDLKSVTLSFLAEQMGLAEPERYTWTLHDRLPGNGSPCLITVLYTVVMRNFDILDTPLNQVQYSPYVNDILYTYFITEFCNGPNPLAFTTPYPVDPSASKVYSSVAAFDLQLGGFYTGFTRDDVAGLRYMLSSNNINYEATASAGGLLRTSNAISQTTLTTLPLSLLYGQAAVTDPNTLLTNYPGLTYISVQTNIVNQFTTNVFAYYTNLTAPFTNSGPNFPGWTPVQYGGFVVPNPVTLSLGDFIAAAATNDPAAMQALYPDLVISQVITNSQRLLVVTNRDPYYTNQTANPVYANNVPGGLGLGYYFTNQPGPTAINYPLTSQLFTNVDLYQFSQQARTNDAAALIALYPSLVILSSYSTPTNQDVPNVTTYFTNALPGSPYGSPPRLITVTNGITRVFYTLYFHTFGNVVTNHAYNSSLITFSTTYVTNYIGAPYPNVYTNTTTVSYYTNIMSGDILIIPTNWCGFQVTATYSPLAVMGVSNTIASSAFTNVVSTNTTLYQFSQSSFFTFTNRTYNVTPGICEPVLVFPTNYTTNIVNSYVYNFGNVVTNHFYTNTLVRVSTTNIFSLPNGFTNTLSTNYIPSFTIYSNTPSGDIFIVPQAWCGYTYTTLSSSLASTTNVFIPGGIVPGSGQSYIKTTISYYTNYTLSMRPGFCEPALVMGTNYSTNQVTTYSYVFGSIITNRYNPNTLARVVTTNYMLIPFGLVGAITNLVTTNFVNIGPSGDFFIVPPNFCALTIISTLANTVTITTNQFAATIAVGPDLGERYTQTTTFSSTNSTFVVQPYVCNTAPPAPTLRRGIEHVQFMRVNYDSLIGQFFQPFTNYYTMTVITNSQQITENYQRVITQPDIRLSAQDLATTPADNIIGNGTAARGIAYDSSQVLQGLRGPGTIRGFTTFTYNKVGPIFLNGPFASTNSFVYEFNQNQQLGLSLPYWASLLQWASFDTSTNPPILYPNGTSLANLANSIYIQMLPATLADGTVGAFYSQAFSAAGGQPPYTWSAPNFSGLVPGMSFNPAAQTISGVPSVAGTFNFIIRLTDSVNRIVDYNYTITIH